MDRSKFDRLVREFPFLEKVILEEQDTAVLPHGRLPGAEYLEDIQVRRADRNLLEVRPGSWYCDCGSWSGGGERKFWVVCPGEIIHLKDSVYKSRAHEGGGYVEEAGLIANQFIEFLDREIGYIVEFAREGYDWDDGWTPTVIIYKMNDFAWRRFCRPAMTAQKS